MSEKAITEVCCAIIEHGGKVLAAQRAKNTSNSGKWEFPGGKIEPGETAHQCVIREIMEELSIGITVIADLESVTHCYPDKAIRLHPFICQFHGDELKVQEHEQVKWFLPSELAALDWSEADVKVLEKYLGLYRKP